MGGWGSRPSEQLAENLSNNTNLKGLGIQAQLEDPEGGEGRGREGDITNYCSAVQRQIVKYDSTTFKRI